MSEPTARSSAPRGRGSGRGGRGGYSSRGGRPRHANGDKTDVTPVVEQEDEGGIGQLLKKHGSSVSTIRELFSDWTNEDAVFALEEFGDLNTTINRISDGSVTRWGEVKKKTKDRGQSKVKDAIPEGNDSAPRNRGGRGRGGDGHRGGRDRAYDRGGSSTRGRGGHSSNGPRKQTAPDLTNIADGGDIPADNSADSWEKELANQGNTTSPDASWEMVTPSEAAPPPVAEAQKPSIPDGTRSWASMLKPAPKPKAVPAKPKAATAPIAELAHAEAQVPIEKPASPEALSIDQAAIEEPATPAIPSEPSVAITPSKDELTETNLEKVEDVSHPVATVTAASTAGTNEPRSTVATPLNSISQQQGLRPGLGGFATTAYKATAGSNRSASYQRRVKEQQEAVVMPGNHAVDRTAVQFGSLGLNGNPDELDVDDEREEAETRTQPPQHSPVAPRASLPPPPQQLPAESPASRPAPGLPSVGQQAPQVSQSELEQPQTAPHSGYGYNQFNNLYGTPSSQAETPATKSYEPFGQQVQQPTTQQPFEGYSTSQAPNQPGGNSTHHSQLGGFTTAGNDYSSYYTSDNQRNAYQNYYGSYGQQSQPTPHETGSSQQRGAGAFGTSGPEQPSVHATSQPQPPQGRYGTTNDAQNSGHSTPNPAGGQHLHGQGQQSHQMGQSHGQGQHGGYPYGGHPYYGSPYYAPYMNQYNYGGNQGAYGSGSYAAGGKFGQPGQQGYGISPQQSSYDPHSASPANTGSYGQGHSAPNRDNASNLYGRTGSAQPSEGQQHNASTFSGMPDSFSRLQSGYPGQSSSQQGSQQNTSEDSTRGFSDKVAGGPSPAPGQAAGRPGSATNNMQGQSGLPTTQGQNQQGYSGYQSQMGHQMPGQQSHYGGGIGGLGHHQSSGQSHQSTGYGGGYGAGFGGNYYNSNNNRGGWGGNYGH